jgi:hypothetical protein
MNTTRPELGFERVLAALECELLGATDEEIVAAAEELGMIPTMKGSAALFGVILLWRPREQKETRPKRAAGQTAVARARRRPKGNEPPST